MAKARNPRGMPSAELLETCNTLHRSTRNLLIQIFPNIVEAAEEELWLMDMAVSASPLAHPHGPPQIRQNRLEVGNHRLHPLPL
jgi:hypothetical protein